MSTLTPDTGGSGTTDLPPGTTAPFARRLIKEDLLA